ncbi:RraA family protein [Aliiroseovarius subalbicans]|uniref:RraA family protein n=1 Tax=Aliiroseovarius subalbicans TaxID=2925840 RepID=UPI001F55C822|nr:RraA family protein [Aliiroseovarius subalbicans]MCI2400904.1 RraA family protein [Aliiroseovarius subalbicans]
MDNPKIDTFKTCYTGVIHDVMRAMGLRNFTLPARIKPLQPDMTLCGPAFTIEGRLDETADAHETLLAWTGLLSKCPEGHIWTAQPHTHSLAQMGELSAETLHFKGVLGCVLDGALRDSHFLIDLGFPSWRTHHTPRDVVAQWLPTGVNVDIMIEDVLIRPGDWLHGDRDGMVRIPVEHLDEILEKSLAAMQTENLVRTAILAGSDPQEAYIKYGKF